jgi:hypothetical protein
MDPKLKLLIDTLFDALNLELIKNGNILAEAVRDNVVRYLA